MNSRGLSIVALLLLLAPLRAAAGEGDVPFNEWAKAQWSLLPEAQRASIPDVRIDVDPITRKRLDVRAEPVTRNVYISSVYAMMARELARCANPTVRVGNWYHFATWASVSAGEVINLQKFDKLGALDKTALWIGAAVRYIPPQSEQVEIFANTNALIALEMIPIGRAFLDTFCKEPGKVVPFEEFSSRFTPKSEHERLLLDALALYRLAIYETDVEAKTELVTAGSILQVFSEQMRVDQLIKSVFDSKFFFNATTRLYKSAATEAGALRIGTTSPLRVRLDRDVPAFHTHPHLQGVVIPELRRLNSDVGVPNVLPDDARVYPKTASKDWSDLASRKRFLAAFFRGFNGVDSLFVAPYENLSFLESVSDYHQLTERIDYNNPDEEAWRVHAVVERLYNRAQEAAGRPDEMERRAMVLLGLYFESKRNLRFALAISHLTLGIDKSSHADAILRKMPGVRWHRIVDDYAYWGAALREINQEMVTRFVLAWDLARWATEKRVTDKELLHGVRFDGRLVEVVRSIMKLLPVMKEVQRAAAFDKRLTKRVTDRHFETLVDWEHSLIIQPRMVVAYGNVGPEMRVMVKNVPDRTTEKLLLERFDMNTTFHLKCFKKKAYLHTKNFMDVTVRIKQARAFYRLLESVGFDDAMGCYRDDYYRLRLPPKFFKAPERYVKALGHR
jgi:hypothetical protein